MKFVHLVIACLVLIAICEAFRPKGGEGDQDDMYDGENGMMGMGRGMMGKGKGHGTKAMGRRKGMERGKGRPGASSIINRVIEFVSKVFPKLKDRLIGAKTKAKSKPCVDTECPPNKVINKTRGYEERCYSNSKWITLSASTKLNMRQGDMISYLRIVGNMMKKVGKYLGGGNKDKVKLNMTAPLLHKYVRPAKGAKATIHLYFYVPSEYQDSVPAPSDSSLSVVGIEMCVYSHRFRFPAFVAEPQQYIHHVRMLKRFLKRDGLDGTYEDGFFYAATYDRLIKMRNRRNEVWLQKKM